MSYKSNLGNVLSRIEQAAQNAAFEAAETIRGQAARNTKVDTGKTKGAWATVSDGTTAIAGNSEQNAIWEEFGTGEYALAGDGRKGGWVYFDEGRQKFYFTKGKKPKRALTLAYNAKKSAAKNIIKKRMTQI